MTIRKSVLVAVIGLIVMLTGSVVALASHQFVDVPSTNVFHADISWLADHDVTRGCNPPTNDEFCPDDPVTRGQMAAFLHRFADTKIETTIAIDQIGFLPIQQDGGYVDYDYQAAGAYGRFAASLPLGASVPVPDGATITGFSATFCDSNGPEDFTAKLLRRPDPDAVAFGETVAEVTSSGSDCAITVSTTDVQNAVVDTSNYSYAIEVRSSGGGSGLFRRATVTYEMPLLP
jgi:hypothetical protein